MSEASSKDKVIKATKLPFEENAVKTLYKDWAYDYDKDMLDEGYNGPRNLVSYIVKVISDKKCKIIDLLGGTGILGKLLKVHGFTNLDILDASEKMLELANKDNLYKEYIKAYLGGDNVIPVPDDTYDHAILCGGFVPGHATSDIFPEVTRIIKPGGMFIWAMREGYVEECGDMQKFFADIEDLCQKGVWKKIETVKMKEYLLGSDGIIYAVQIM